jgi:MutS domain I
MRAILAALPSLHLFCDEHLTCCDGTHNAYALYQVGKFYELFHMDSDVGMQELDLIYMKV